MGSSVPHHRASDMKVFSLHFQNVAGQQISHFVWTYQRDERGEPVFDHFSDSFSISEIRQELIAPYCHHGNGVADWKICTLYRSTRVLFLYNQRDKTLWPKALVTAAYVRNSDINPALLFSALLILF